MDETILWEKEMDEAKGLADKENKPILLDFHNPG